MEVERKGNILEVNKGHICSQYSETYSQKDPRLLSNNARILSDSRH